MLTLDLAQMERTEVRGVYGSRFDIMPDRALFLHPDAAASWRKDLGSWAIVSDMFRTPESSLRAVETGRGAQPPGYSAHNFGLAIDLALETDPREHGAGALVRLGMFLGLTRAAKKLELDAFMEDLGWYCHRRDHVLAHEAWHYNYLGKGATIAGQYTSDEIERRIVEIYGHALAPNDADCQRALARLKLYGGAIDGDVGPLTRKAAEVFERGWGLKPDGVLDAKTRRTLAYVACERRLT